MLKEPIRHRICSELGKYGSHVPTKVHLRFRFSQVALHLLDSESPFFEPLLEEAVQKALYFLDRCKAR